MRFTLVLCFAAIVIACGGPGEERSPLDTLKDYSKAIRNKDTTQMKLLLSAETLKVHREQAKAQKVTLDEIVQRETFFPPDQRVFAFRNEKIEGDKATVEVKNTFGGWDQIFLVRENGEWKIDKKGTVQEMIEQSDVDSQELDDKIESERKKIDEQLQKEEAAKDILKQASPLEPPSGSNPPPVNPETDYPGSPPSPIP